MKTRALCLSISLSLLCLTSSVLAANDTNSIRQKFIGDFELVSYVAFADDGSGRDMNYIGRLSYDKFDNMATVTNFIIVPLSFLSGTFYSVERLPDILKSVSYYNPFFHMIDGFRYSFINDMDGTINFGVFYLSIISILIWLISYYLYKSGYKIKS